MELVARIAAIVFYFIHLLIRAIYKLFFDKEKRRQLPKFDDKLLSISAKKLAEKIRRQEICSEEVVKSYIKRIEEVNPIINAVVEERFTEAIKEAKEIDDLLERSQFEDKLKEIARSKPLLGVPVTVKECFAVNGMSYTGCSLIRKGVKATEDADAVVSLKNAGAVILLVSNTPEYCMSVESNNNLVGRARNPYNTKCTPGGSSGGEGALLGAGASVVGLGSDIAGSIRFPCAYNGIFGHKPTAGIVSMDGSFPVCPDPRFFEYLVAGPMTRYVEDLSLVYKVLADKNVQKLKLDENVDISKLKVFYMVDGCKDFGLAKVHKDIQAAIKEAAWFLNKSFKCELDERKFDLYGHSFEMTGGLIFSMEDPVDIFKDSKGKYSYPIELIKYIFGKSIFSQQILIFTLLERIKLGVNEAKKQKYLKQAEEDKKTLKDALGDNGILIAPSCCGPAFEHFGHLGAMTDIRFSGIFNILGFPTTSVPTRFTKNGMPIGIQIVAAPYNDHLCLAVAEELSTYFGGWQPPN